MQEDLNYVKVSCTDKKTSVHQRLIWSCAWTGDSKYFATSSRDKKVAIWEGKGESEDAESSCLGAFALACAKPLQVADSATAVAIAPETTSEGNSEYY